MDFMLKDMQIRAKSNRSRASVYTANCSMNICYSSHNAVCYMPVGHHHCRSSIRKSRTLLCVPGFQSCRYIWTHFHRKRKET